MDDVTLLLSKLTTSESIVQQEKITIQIIQLLCEINEDDDDDESNENAVQEAIIQSEAIDLYVKHLLEDATDKETFLTSACQLIAELAKTESLREPLVERGFMPLLLRQLPSSNITLATQACRALGNICFDNDLGRSAVEKENGIPIILNVLEEQNVNTKEGSARLRVILCGFLLNLTNNCASLQEKAIESGVLSKLNSTITSHLADEDLTNMALLTVNSITESECGKSGAVAAGLVDTCHLLLDRGSNPQALTEMVLELLTVVMETETAKSQAAANGLCDCLIREIESPQADSPLVKMASDVFISILVGDESMETLYASGEGRVFLQSMQWLDSDTGSLQTLGALAIGNFARRDAYCQQMVECGVLDKLISVLRATSVTTEANFTLQHAVLSTLRNLAIPACNKPVLLTSGVMEACLTLLNTEVMAVVFKLLGVLRMLIEGQESAAIKLGQELAFLDCLTEWCTVEAHAGVKGEATRVIASLVKNSKSSAVIQNLIRSEALAHLVSMVTSEHLLMQNEAIMALTIISSVAIADASVPLKEAGLSSTLMTLLRQQTLPSQVLLNVLSLITAVSTSDKLKEDIVSAGVVDELRSIAEGHTDVKVKEQARSALNAIEEVMSVG